MRRWIVAVVMLAGMWKQGHAQITNPNVTLTGTIQGANGLPAANTILSFTPSQAFYVLGTGTQPPVGVSQIIAGTNVTVSPAGGMGAVTVNALGSGGSEISQLNAFGDSLTYGFSSTGANATSYAAWLAAAAGVTSVTNYGYPGYTSNQEDAVIWKANLPYAPTDLISYMIGTNNFEVAGGTANANQQQIYQNNILGQLAWMLMPSSQRIPFGTGAVTYTGNWVPDSLIGRVSITNGDTATITGTGNVLYLTTYANNGNSGSATLTCDGTPTGATLLFTGVGGASLTQSAGQTVRVSLSAGAHSCTITNTTSAGGSYIELEWAAFVTGTTQNQSPIVLFGQIPDAFPLQSGVSGWRANQAAVVATLTGDGFANLHLVTTAGAVPQSTQYYNDQLHNNNYGYYLLAQPFISTLNTVLGTSYANNVIAGYFAAPSYDYCAGGQNNNCGAYGAGAALTTGVRNLLEGVYAGHIATTASDNVFQGFSSGSTCIGCTTSAATGSSTLTSFNGAGATAMGYAAGYRDQSSFITVLGANADSNTSGVGGVGKTIVGAGACQYAEGSGNVCIGQGAGVAASTTIANLSITQTQLTSNVATYTYTLTSGLAPAVNQLVTVSYTSNGSGVFNVSQAVITTATGGSSGSFTIALTGPNYAAQAEFGGATTTSATVLAITTSSLATTGVATYGYTLTSGPAPAPNQLITVTGTTNGGGLLNCRGFAVLSIDTVGHTISVGGFFAGISYAQQAESGAATLSITNNLTTDFSNTIIGTGAGKNTSAQINNAIAIGNGAQVTQSDNVQLGALSMKGGFVGPYRIAISNNTGDTQFPETTLTYAPTVAFLPLYRLNTITLTGNVTAYNMPGGDSEGVTMTGLPVTVNICQDSVGGHTFDNSAGTGGTGFRGFFTIGTTANTCSVQTFIYSLAKGSWMATGSGLTNQ